ncbi:MAG: sigma-70 family RNA polymerase sigma factor [Solirubrobacteraceae bacterium]
MTTAPLTRLEDSDLVRRVARGDVRAFEAIYDRHSAQVFGLAMRVTGRRRAAEEATQDAFLGVWRAARSYDQSRGTCKTWLLSMVRNRSIDWLRREARHGRDVEIDDALFGRLEAAERTEEQVAEREESVHARNLVLSLPDDQRRVIELAYFKGLTQSEISEKVGIPLGTVKGRQRLALKKMHRNLTSGPECALTESRTLVSHDGATLATAVVNSIHARP